MFKLLRYFSIATLIAITSVTIFLGLFYRQTAIKDLIKMGEAKNVALTQAFINSLWPQFGPFVRSVSELSPDELQGYPELDRLHKAVLAQMKGLSVVKVKIYNLDGMTVFSTEPSQIGQDKSMNPGFLSARSGTVISELTHRGQIYSFEGELFHRDILSSYLPIRKGPGPVEAVFELYSDVTPLVERIKHTQRKMVTGVIGSLLFLYMVLFFIARHADRIIKRQSVALVEQANRDILTGLYNRRYFNCRIEEEIRRADRNQHLSALLLCDLDHFKAINDTRGHQFGDQILVAVAKGIEQSTRGTDLVFRWGGDEFAIILSNTSREGGLIVAERIRNSISRIIRDIDLKLDLSIGIALYPEHGRSADALIRKADLALYIAKQEGDKVHVGSEHYKLDEHCVKLVFQPIVAVQPIVDTSSSQIIGYEALSRDPEGKLSILELFKKYKAIGKLNELKLICFQEQINAAHKAKLQRVFINVDFSLLSQTECIPKSPDMEVILEISETEAIHSVKSYLETITRWRDQGYKFAIDDFGAGFISLPFIAQLVPAYIKVDRSSMLQAVASEQFRKFLLGMLIGLKTYVSEGIIAEGVETEKELQVMQELGIHLIQGFLFGKPQELE
jgi:diguanylate cyclase (GGDEF)-like protein